MNYIRTTTSAGFDWHDTFDDNQQILWNGNPIIHDVNTTVFTILRNTITDLALDTPCPFLFFSALVCYGTKNTHGIFYTTMRIRSLISAYQSTMTLSQTTIDKP